MTFPRRTLGESGLDVSAIGLGCFPFSGSYGAIDEDAAIAVVRCAIELGMTFLDTADIYGPYTSELFVAKAIKGRRGDVQIASKFGAVPPAGATIRGDREYVHLACEASLQRLETDYLDLYYAHRLDPNVPVEETVGAMAELVSEGKVRHLGLCEVGPQTLRRAHAVYPITALQSEWSLWVREIELSVLPAARELGIAVVPYSPLGRGFLTGRVRSLDELAEDDFRRKLPRFEAENFRHNLGFVDRIEELAREKGCTAAQLALAWLCARGPDVVPIPGSDRIEFVRENADSATIALTADDLRRIDDFAPIRGAVAGSRSRAGQAVYDEPAD